MVVKLSGFYRPSIPTVTWDPELKMLVAKEKTKTEQSGLGTWMFSFIDLITLAALAKCGMIMKMCACSLHTVMFVTTIITILFVTRLQIDDYCNRFYTNDVFHRILYFVYMLCFYLMALNLGVSYTGDYEPNDYICQSNLYGYGFGAAFTTTRVIIFLLQGSAIFADSTHVVAKQFAMDMLRGAISAGVAFVQDLIVNSGDEFPPPGRYKIYVSCLAIEMTFYAWHHIALYYQERLCSWTIEIQEVYWQIGEYLVGREACPVDVDEYSERMSAFVMIVLGQMVALITLVYYSETSEGQYRDFAMLSMWLAFSFGVLYFDCAEPEAIVPPEDNETEETHAAKKKKRKKKKKEIEDKVDRWKAQNGGNSGDTEMAAIGAREVTPGGGEGATSASVSVDEDRSSPVGHSGNSNASTGSGGSGSGKKIESEDTPTSESESEGKEERGGEKNSTKSVSVGAFSLSLFSLSTGEESPHRDGEGEGPEAEGAAEGPGKGTKQRSGSLWDLGSVITGRSNKSEKSNASAKSNASSVSNASSRADTLPERKEGDSLEDQHAMNHSLLSSFLYTWLHLVLCLSMFFAITAVTIVYYDDVVKTDAIPEQIMSDIPQEFLEGDHAPMMSPSSLLSLSIFVSLISLTLLRLLTNGLEQLLLPRADGGRSIRINTGIKVFLASTHLLVPAFNLKDEASACALHGFLMTCSVLTQIRFKADAPLDATEEEKNLKARNSTEALRESAGARRKQIEQMAAFDGGATMTENPLHKSLTGESGANSVPKSPPKVAGIHEATPDTRGAARDKIAFLARRRKMGLQTGTRSVPAGSVNVAPLGLGLPPPPSQ